MNEYQEKIRSIATPRRWGRSHRREVVNQNNGRRAGYHREHWDDHVDAVAQPGTIKAKFTQSQED